MLRVIMGTDKNVTEKCLAMKDCKDCFLRKSMTESPSLNVTVSIWKGKKVNNINLQGRALSVFIFKERCTDGESPAETNIGRNLRNLNKHLKLV